MGRRNSLPPNGQRCFYKPFTKFFLWRDPFGTAPVGPLGLASLRISTRALASGDATNDSTYNNLEKQLSIITSLPDDLASRMEDRLEDAEFHNKPIHWWEARAFSSEAQALLDYTEAIEHAK